MSGIESQLIEESNLYIGGEWVAGEGGPQDVVDPRDERTTGHAATASISQVDEAVRAAREAFPYWSNTSPSQRNNLLRALHELIFTNAEEFASVISREMGAPDALARQLHVNVPLDVLAMTAEALSEFEFTSAIGHSTIVREPVGVVGAITPWNLPLHQVLVKIAPALAGGNCIVLKPSELTPLTTFLLGRCIEAAGFPAGVFNLINGDGPGIGTALTSHLGVDHVSFTGSTTTGKLVAKTVLERIGGLTLELGGKSASIVLTDTGADRLAGAVKYTVGSCFLNAGQTCTALTRLIVPRTRLAEVEQIAASAAAKYRPGERLGPLISEAQRNRVLGYLDQSSTGGARRLNLDSDVGLPDEGYFVLPTVLSDVDPNARTARDEIFGPVLSVIACDDDEHALSLANDSVYGLGGAVWSDDDDRALRFALRMRAGQVDVNGAKFNPRAPFGGYRQSGVGREIGEYGIASTLEVKAIQL